MSGLPTSQSVLVAGDVIVDWNFAIASKDTEPFSAWSPTERTHIHRHFGGSMAIYHLIKRIADQNKGHKFSAYSLDDVDENIGPGDEQFNHAYLLWSRYPASVR